MARKIKVIIELKTRLKVGDVVVVRSGGNAKTNPLKGKTGKIVRFVGAERDRAVVEGLNFVTKHQKQKTMDGPSGKIRIEAPIHLSRLSYYVEKLKKPVKLSVSTLKDGKRVRGYVDPESKSFVQL